MRKVHSDEAGKADKDRRGVEAPRPGSMDGPSKTYRCGKRHTSAVNGGCKRDRSYKSAHPVVGTAWRCDTVQTRTAAARCRGAIQQDIFTTQTCCVSSSQRQGLPALVLCHRHHLETGGPYMIRMKKSQKQARKTCKVNILYTQCIRRVLRSSFLQRTACTPPFVVSFQWETRDLYTLVCLDQGCYHECEWIDLSRGYLTWADTISKPTTCREAPHIALRTSWFATFLRNQPMLFRQY